MRLRNRDLISLLGLTLIAVLVISTGLRLSGAWGAAYSLPASCTATAGGVISSANWNSCLADMAGNGINKIDNNRVTANAAIVGSKLDLTSGTERITSTGGTLTTDLQGISQSLTWSNAAVAFTGWKLSVTDTNSDAASLLVDLLVGGTSKFKVSKAGAVTAASTGEFSGLTVGTLAGLLKGTAGVVSAITATTSADYVGGDFATHTLNQATVAGLTTASSPTFAGLGATPIVSSYTGTHSVAGVFNVLGSAGSPAGQAYIKSAAAGTIGLVVDTAASSTVGAQEWRLNGTRYQLSRLKSNENYFGLDPVNLGDNVAGPVIAIGRNSSAGGYGPSAGTLLFVRANDAAIYTWSDLTGKLRIHTAAPTGSGGSPTVADTDGTVVGDQTSWHEAKDILRQWDDPTKALEVVLKTKIFDFKYKQSSYLDVDNKPAVFTGIVGFDRRDPFMKNVGRQQTPSLNEINLHGYTILSIQALDKRLRAVEARN